MNIKSQINKTPLAGCVQTNINNDLLEALLTNKRRTEKYKRINPITSGGHGPNDPSRQILSYLMRRALNLVRRPGTYDIELKSEIFVDISNEELEDAVKDVRRIYEHTQVELKNHGKFFRLVRGICDVEASVCGKLLEEIDDDNIHFYFRTVTFFNHISAPFSRQMTVNIDCPASWIWASAYTLKELELLGSDEEFIVVCQAVDGMMKIPKSGFTRTTSLFPIETEVNINKTVKLQNGLHEALSALMHEGFEPDDYRGTYAKYRAGKWEERLMKVGRWLDTKFNRPRINRVSLFQK